MTWEQLKTACQTIYSQYIGNGKLIDSDSGSPTQLALLVSLVHNKIANYSQEFEFLKVDGIITLTGANSYDLGVLFPDFKSLYQVYGVYDNQEATYYPNNEANITPCEGYTIKGKTLYFTGSFKTSGTIKIQYKSKYLVKDIAGNRKKYFEDDTDYSVLDNENLEIFGIGEFVQWKADTKAKERRDDVKVWFKEAWEELLVDNVQTKQVDSIL